MVLSELAWDRPSAGQLILRARQARGWSQTVVARKMAAVRRDRWGDDISAQSLKSMLSRWENGRVTIDRQNREILAEAFSSTAEALFGPDDARVLPRPLMVEVQVTDATVQLLRAQRRIHSQTEHAFGPYYAAELIRTDLVTIDGLLPAARPAMRASVRAVAALIAELGGWIAQDGGDLDRALALTSRAYAQVAGDRPIEAMVLMRWANLETARDPALAAELAQRAADVASELPPGRLHASIARQQAHAAAALADRTGFERHAALAADHATAPAGDDELTTYATPPYIASETAAGLLVLDRPAEAADVLAEHLGSFSETQGRDHGVALSRWLQALATQGDLDMALDHCDAAFAAYLRAPSVRASGALRAIVAQPATTQPARDLHRRVTALLEGNPQP